MFGDKADPLDNTVRFLRITCLGTSGCGKTSLISSFVNSLCPMRCPSTESVSLFYRKIELTDDDSGFNEKAKSVFLEIEDTPGCERGHDSMSSGGDADPMKIRKGSRVSITRDKKELAAAFHRYKAKKGRSLLYERGMDAMLGSDFTVKSVGDGTFGLAAREGGDVWEFPAEVLELRLCTSLPIDPFLELGEKPQEGPSKVQARKKHVAAQQRPLSSYERPCGPPGTDKSITKNRMGFLFCFDVSDEEMFSLKEAIQVFRMLQKRSENQKGNFKFVPIVWLVACKSDKTSNMDIVNKNLHAAKRFAEDEDIVLKVTSARKHEGTWEVFCEMARVIEGKTGLWLYRDNDGEENEDEDEAANCSLQ